MIISASRRTDIPTYYSNWFLNRVKAGYVYAILPLCSLYFLHIFQFRYVCLPIENYGHILCNKFVSHWLFLQKPLNLGRHHNPWKKYDTADILKGQYTVELKQSERNTFRYNEEHISEEVLCVSEIYLMCLWKESHIISNIISL